MKKTVCILVLVCISVGVIFAQEKAAASEKTTAAASGERKNGIALDLFPFLKGVIASGDGVTYFCTVGSYERLIAPHYSIGGNIDLYIGSYSGMSANYFSLAAEGRYYTQSESFEKTFLGATLGF